MGRQVLGAAKAYVLWLNQMGRQSTRFERAAALLFVFCYGFLVSLAILAGIFRSEGLLFTLKAIAVALGLTVFGALFIAGLFVQSLYQRNVVIPAPSSIPLMRQLVLFSRRLVDDRRARERVEINARVPWLLFAVIFASLTVVPGFFIGWDLIGLVLLAPFWLGLASLCVWANTLGDDVDRVLSWPKIGVVVGISFLINVAIAMLDYGLPHETYLGTIYERDIKVEESRDKENRYKIVRIELNDSGKTITVESDALWDLMEDGQPKPVSVLRTQLLKSPIEVQTGDAVVDLRWGRNGEWFYMALAFGASVCSLAAAAAGIWWRKRKQPPPSNSQVLPA